MAAFSWCTVSRICGCETSDHYCKLESSFQLLLDEFRFITDYYHMLCIVLISMGTKINGELTYASIINLSAGLLVVRVLS